MSLNANTQSTLSAAAIEQQIVADIKSCEELLMLLEQEQQALKDREPDQLESIIEKKTVCLEQLENSANKRTQWIRSFNNSEDQEGLWNQLIVELNRPELSEQWDKLKRLTTKCREKNEINGKVMARNQQVFSRLLTILRGQQNSVGLYTAKGSAYSASNSLKVGEA